MRSHGPPRADLIGQASHTSFQKELLLQQHPEGAVLSPSDHSVSMTPSGISPTEQPSPTCRTLSPILHIRCRQNCTRTAEHPKACRKKPSPCCKPWQLRACTPSPQCSAYGCRQRQKLFRTTATARGQGAQVAQSRYSCQRCADVGLAMRWEQLCSAAAAATPPFSATGWSFYHPANHACHALFPFFFLFMILL